MFITKQDGKYYGGSLKDELDNLHDGSYQVEFTLLETRSLKQNAYIWGWIYPQVEQAFKDKGIFCTIQDVHEWGKSTFLKKRKKCKITKRFRKVEGSTRKLSRKGFKQYIENIKMYCIDKLSISIRDADDIEEFYN